MAKATRILGFRLDPNDPRKVIRQEVSEEVYFSLGRPIWQHQWKMRSQGKCGMDDRTEMWKCDGDCELCQFRLAGKDCRLDAPVGSADGDGCTAGEMIPSNAPGTEEAALNRATMEQLFKRLGEVYPEAMDVARLMMVKQRRAKLPSIPRTSLRTVVFLSFAVASLAVSLRILPECVFPSHAVKLRILASIMALPMTRRPLSPRLSQWRNCLSERSLQTKPSGGIMFW